MALYRAVVHVEWSELNVNDHVQIDCIIAAVKR